MRFLAQLSLPSARLFLRKHLHTLKVADQSGLRRALSAPISGLPRLSELERRKFPLEGNHVSWGSRRCLGKEKVERF